MYPIKSMEEVHPLRKEMRLQHSAAREQRALFKIERKVITPDLIVFQYLLW